MEEDKDGNVIYLSKSLVFYNNNLQIRNDIIKFNNKVKDINRNYELNR